MGKSFQSIFKKVLVNFIEILRTCVQFSHSLLLFMLNNLKCIKILQPLFDSQENYIDV